MALDARAAWRAWASFRGAGAGTRAFVAARLAVAPLGLLGAEVRALRGRILSLGCGYGVVDRYLAETNPDIVIDGIELDPDRVAVAGSTAELAPRVNVRVADVTRLEADRVYAGALCVDLFHHVPFDEHAAIARATWGSLEAGGVFLVKDIATTPRRQYLWNRLHDRVVVGREPISCRAPDDMATVLARAGFAIHGVRRSSPLGLYPHYLVVARKRA